MSGEIDRIEIYKKLVSIKPFFEDVEKIKRRKAANKDAFETGRSATLVRGAGGVYFEHAVAGAPAPKFLLY